MQTLRRLQIPNVPGHLATRRFRLDVCSHVAHACQVYIKINTALCELHAYNFISVKGWAHPMGALFVWAPPVWLWWLSCAATFLFLLLLLCAIVCENCERLCATKPARTRQHIRGVCGLGVFIVVHRLGITHLFGVKVSAGLLIRVRFHFGSVLIN